MTDALECGCKPDACPLELARAFAPLWKRLETMGGPPPNAEVTFLQPKWEACKARRLEAKRERERLASMAKTLAPLVLAKLREEGLVPPEGVPIASPPSPTPQISQMPITGPPTPPAAPGTPEPPVPRISVLRHLHGDVRAICIAPCIKREKAEARMQELRPVLDAPPFRGLIEFGLEPLAAFPGSVQLTAYYRGPREEDARRILRERQRRLDQAMPEDAEAPNESTAKPPPTADGQAATESRLST